MAIAGVPITAGIADALKVWIYEIADEKTGRLGDAVCGLIAPGTAVSLSAQWDSPLMQATAGNASGFDATAANLQIASGKTTLALLNTTQVWGGNQPLSFNLSLSLVAFTDPATEVMQALEYLGKFASSRRMAENVSLGQSDIPQMVQLNIGRSLIVPNCVIESLGYQLDKERNDKGELLRTEVTLTVATKTMLDATKIVKLFHS